MENQYIVKASAAQMPASCWGKYKRVAVLEVESGVTDVAMISTRARGVVSIVETWEACRDTGGPRCAYTKALVAAEALAAKLNQTKKAG